MNSIVQALPSPMNERSHSPQAQCHTEMEGRVSSSVLGKRKASSQPSSYKSSSIPKMSKRSGLDILLDQQDACPVDIAVALFQDNGFHVEAKPTLKSERFSPPTEEEVAAYDQETIQAVRNQDVDALRNLHASGRSLQCCNRFGESLLHMACRRGFTSVVRFMVEEVGVSLFVRDDYGRTPMHDACWSSTPNFEIAELLMREAPEQIFLSDVRGHTPLSYVRKENWKEWVKFLSERQNLLRLKRRETSLPKQVASKSA